VTRNSADVTTLHRQSPPNSQTQLSYLTSNVTAITEVQSASFGAGVACTPHCCKFCYFSIYVCTYRLFAGMRHSLVSVITTHYYVAKIVSSSSVVGITRFLCTMHVLEVRASSSSPRLPFFPILFLSWPLLLS